MQKLANLDRIVDKNTVTNTDRNTLRTENVDRNAQMNKWIKKIQFQFQIKNSIQIADTNSNTNRKNKIRIEIKLPSRS